MFVFMIGVIIGLLVCAHGRAFLEFLAFMASLHKREKGPHDSKDIPIGWVG